MRRFCSALAAAAIVVALAMAVPSTAHAAQPLPDPVVPVQDLPSQLHSYVWTNPPLGSEAYAEQQAKAQAILKANGFADPSDLPPSTTAAPKPITTAAKFLRTGGAVIGAAQVGWALGQGGLSVYALATGQDYQSVVCAAPQWYSDANSFVMMGMGPDCTEAVGQPNADQLASGTLSYQGYTVQSYAGWGTWTNDAHTTSVTVFCINPTGSAPNGTSLDITGPSTSSTSGVRWGTFNACSPLSGVNMIDPNYPTIALKSSSGGAVLSTMTWVKPDPTRSPSCVITWSDGTTTTGAGEDYTEEDGVPLSAQALGCSSAYGSKASRPAPGGTGTWPTRIAVKSATPDGTVTTISDQTVPAYTPEQKAAILPPSNTAGGGLVLRKTVDGKTDNCLTWAVSCAGWWAATSNGTVPTTGTTTYQCTYNGVGVALTECLVYQNTFESQTSTPPITNPVTGNPIQWGTKPDGVNSTDPGSGINPGQQCMSEWPSAPDPISWVLHPVKCALVWAFVPRQSVIDAFQEGIDGGFGNSGLASFFAAFDPLAAAFAIGAGSCQGLPFHLEGPGWEFNTTLFAACDEPMAGVAATVRNLLIFVIYFGGGLACIRYVAGIFGYLGFGDNPKASSGVRFE